MCTSFVAVVRNFACTYVRVYVQSFYPTAVEGLECTNFVSVVRNLCTTRTYVSMYVRNFTPATVEGLMCTSFVSVMRNFACKVSTCVRLDFQSHYGVATISSLLKTIGLFCKRAL